MFRQGTKSINEVFCLPWSVKRFNNKSSDDYQYLQKSKVATLHFQPSLPRLPIPDLSKSCKRYLRGQKPLRKEEEYLSLERVVQDFEINEGASLQKELQYIDSTNKHTSYISAPWFEMYLKDRKPLPINYNPFLVFIDDPKPDYNDQLIRATNLLISSLRFMKTLRKNYLEPEVYHLNPKKSDNLFFRKFTGALPSFLSWYGAYLMKAYPLDMSQYENLFNTSRIPEIGIDRLHHDPTSRHIIVLKKGNIYKLDVLDDAGLIHDSITILSCLKEILNDDKLPAKFPIGVLTTQDRNKWAKARKHLEYIGNQKQLHLIDSGIFVLVLDCEEPTRDYKELIHRYLHSDGASRWFDKSFSLIVGKNGIAGINFEHSWGDGVAVLRYFTDVYKDSTENPQVHPNTGTHNKSDALISSLDFVLDDISKQNIQAAEASYSAICSSLGIEVFEFMKFGRSLCKVHDISPDSLMQLAFQIAHYKLNRSFVSTYESCSTAAFKHGRTETVRPCTVETKRFCEAICGREQPNKTNLLQLMKDCSQVHGNLIKDAAMGQGFDRHFFALKLISEKRGKIPELFADAFYKTMNHYTISTSTLSSDLVMLGAFGPVVPDGYGIGYSIWNERLGSIVSHYKGASDGAGFISCLQESLNDLHAILK